MYVAGVTNGRIFQRQASTKDVFVGDIDPNGGAVNFRSNGTTYMTLATNGNFLIGTTTNSTFKLDVNGSIRSNSTIESVNSKSSTSLAVGSISPSGVAGRIDATNDIVAFSTSDARLKENFVKISNPLQKINKISGYEFDWKEDYKQEHGFQGHDIGVIAQEIESVLPQIVTTKFNGYKGVKYEKIIPLLIESIKDLQKEIEVLKSRL
jgi:hypothetical protein